MKKVLLAINGDIPTHSIYSYSVDLCRRMKAGLDIVQFLKENKLTDCISSTKKKVGSLGRFVEDSFAGVAFAEENLPQTGLNIAAGISPPLKYLILEDNPDVLNSVTLSEGELETELSELVEDRKDIVLAIFDPSTEKRRHEVKGSHKIKLLRKKLCVPLVVVKN